jgi:hypothetical protein
VRRASWNAIGDHHRKGRDIFEGGKQSDAAYKRYFLAANGMQVRSEPASPKLLNACSAGTMPAGTEATSRNQIVPPASQAKRTIMMIMIPNAPLLIESSLEHLAEKRR